MSKKIVLTGGGTAGHVTPNIAILDKLKENDYSIEYIGSYTGIEKELIEAQGIKYHMISTGKLRRQLSFKNFTDIFRVVKGYIQAKRILKKVKPNIVFSKGGFVAVPVVLAASKLSIPIVIHESDLTPGLATKISIPKAKKVCCSFEKTLEYLPKSKSECTGLPIRGEIFNGNVDKAKELLKFSRKLPVVLVIGGSSGALNINRVIHSNVDKLTKYYNIVHVCGKEKVDTSLNKEGYIQFEYLKSELADILRFADIVVSRAGANAINELLLLKKLNILIPLSRVASRGDQILNANEFVKLGYSYKIDEDDLDCNTLLKAINEVIWNREKYLRNMQKNPTKDPISRIVEILNNFVEKNND